MAEIVVDRIIQKRDVDAALYLLRRMLSLGDDCVGSRRRYLQTLASRLERKEELGDAEKKEVIDIYREVVG